MTHYLPEITNGVLWSRHGEVHQADGKHFTGCGRSIPSNRVEVSHVQAVVHKLRLCGACYPHHQGPGGRHAQR